MYYASVSVRLKGKKWQARLRHKDVSGKWHNTDRMLPDATGKRDAEKKARALMDELNKAASAANEGSELNNQERTVSAVVREFIEGQFQRGELESSTYHSQLTAFEKNIEPYLGNIIFATLDRASIMDWHTKLSAQGMSQHGIYYNYTIITKVYNYYDRIGEIRMNPFHTLPKGIQKGKKTRVTHLTQDQMEKFVVAAYSEFEPTDEMYAAVFLAFYGGLRRGEICGLRWRDIDWDRNELTISSAIGIGLEGSYTKNPKNKSSARTFPMLPQLRTILHQRYEAIKPEPQDFVCSNRSGLYLNPSSFSYKFKRFIDAYNLEDAYGKNVIPHGLRHNLATVGIRSNMDIAALSLMMGHSSRSMTLDVYGDANKISKIVSAEKLSQTFKNESEKFLEGTEEELSSEKPI